MPRKELNEEDFLERVKEDEIYKKYRSILKTVRGGLDILAVKKEAQSLHAARISRSLYEKRVIPSKLIEAEAQDSSNRSRLAELRVSLINEQELLDTTIKLCKKHLKSEYHDEYMSLSGTATGRNNRVDQLFMKGSEYLEQLNTTMSILDIYMRDIDASGFKHTNIKELFKILLGKKESL